MTGSTPYFITELFSKFRQGILTEDEQMQLENWIAAEIRNAELWEEVNDEVLQQQRVRQMAAYDENAALERFWEKHPEMGEPDMVPASRSFRLWKWAAAAAVVVLTAGAAWWIMQGSGKTDSSIVAKSTMIQPGKEGAILTLADGTELLLDSAGNGVIATQQGAQAVIQDGKLAYKPSGETITEIVYNTMSTPRGRQFRLSLPDGTQVWLNSASSIRYPTTFTGADRKVDITGEAYFEVAQKANQPFFVKANNRVEVQVLGTHFNVNAFSNEHAVNTTLLEGAVKVNGALLKPGQRAKVLHGAAQGQIQIEYTDVDRVMAWKNGRFNFEGATLEEIMRQIERWYDVEVEYRTKKTRVEFEGQMTMDVSLNDLIILMEKTGIHLRLEGRKLIVLP